MKTFVQIHLLKKKGPAKLFYPGVQKNKESYLMFTIFILYLVKTSLIIIIHHDNIHNRQNEFSEKFYVTFNYLNNLFHKEIQKMS